VDYNLQKYYENSNYRGRRVFRAALAKHLTQKGHGVILLDIHDIDESEYPKGAKFIRGDIRDKRLMEKILNNVDAIIHAAAALPLWKKEDITSVNIQGTKNMLEASLKNNVKHFIYISSTAVYGVPKNTRF